MSCSEPRPLSTVAVAPPNRITGDCAICAFLSAVIVFVTLAQDDLPLKLTVAGVTGAILILDWVAMLYAHAILKWMGTALHVFAVVLGVTQVALGLNVILQSLNMIGLLNTPAN